MVIRKEYGSFKELNDTVSLGEFKKLRAEGDREYAEKKNRAKQAVVKKADHGTELRWLDGCRCVSCGKTRRNARSQRLAKEKRDG